MPDNANEKFRDVVAEVAAAYLRNSRVSISEISAVIDRIAASLAILGESPLEFPTSPSTMAGLSPAQIKRSIRPDALISFEDGRPYKTLRRHLSSKGLTPEQYREKWGLPDDYPMVAARYSAARAQLAKNIGLGNSRKTGAVKRRVSTTSSGSRRAPAS